MCLILSAVFVALAFALASWTLSSRRRVRRLADEAEDLARRPPKSVGVNGRFRRPPPPALALALLSASLAGCAPGAQARAQAWAACTGEMLLRAALSAAVELARRAPLNRAGYAAFGRSLLRDHGPDAVRCAALEIVRAGSEALPERTIGFDLPPVTGADQPVATGPAATTSGGPAVGRVGEAASPARDCARWLLDHPAEWAR